MERCAHVDSQLSKARSTALHAASYFGHGEIVDLLLDNHANYTLKNDHALTALEEAVPACAAVFSQHPWVTDNSGEGILPNIVGTSYWNIGYEYYHQRVDWHIDWILAEYSELTQHKDGPPANASTAAAAAGTSTVGGTVKDGGSNKFCADLLQYGDRSDFLGDISAFLRPCPVGAGALMEALRFEFSRDIQWTEKGKEDVYTAVGQWREATDRLDELRDHPEAANLEDVHLLALRLYTMPAYVPVNTYLRELTKDGFPPGALQQDPAWSAFTWAILQAFDKLKPALHAGGGSVQPMPVVYRGIGMPLTPAFLTPDQRGMISGLDYAFGSTSLEETEAMKFALGRRSLEEFKASGDTATVFKIHQCVQDAAGFHSGVKLQWISAFPIEAEVLFPPFTLFRVMEMHRKDNITTLEVCPTWTSSPAWSSQVE